MKKGTTTLLLLWACTWPSPATAETRWRVDPGPSSVHFKVRHLIFSQVDGCFRRFSGEVVAPTEDFSSARITTIIPVDSVYTGHADRDNELKGNDFFSAKEHPVIRFESTSVAKTADRSYEIAGELTIRGVTRPIELKAEYLGQRALSMDRLRADFRATGTLNRFDYGLKWNEVIEAGRALVGESVEIVLDIALIRESGRRRTPG